MFLISSFLSESLSSRPFTQMLRNQVTAVGAPATVPTGDKIGVAAKALSDASYPFLKEVQGSEGHIFWGHCHGVFVCRGMHGKSTAESSSVMW